MLNHLKGVDIHGAMNKFPACAPRVIESNSNTSDLNQCEAYFHCDTGICNVYIMFNVGEHATKYDTNDTKTLARANVILNPLTTSRPRVVATVFL